QETGDPLCAMVHEGIEADIAPTFAVQRRDRIQRKNVALRTVAATFEVQDLHGIVPTVPRGKVLFGKFRVGVWVGGQDDGFGGPDAGNLMMAVASVNAAPSVDDDVGAEGADYADHVFEDLIAPDFFGFFGSFGIAKIAGAGEVELHAIAARGGEQFLGADETKLRSLFGA